MARPDLAAPEGDVPAAGRDRARPKLGIVFWLSAIWIAILVFFALFVDLLPIRDPSAQGILTREVASFERPGWNAFFGADSNGRDLFANVVHGARPAVILGTVVTIASATLGSMLGVAAGYLRGRFDTVVMTATDIALAFPALILLIAVRASYGNGMLVFIVIFSILGIPGYTRIVRGATLTLSEREFVEAARSMGATHWRVILRELVPNIVLPVLSFAFIGFAIVIAAEGGLAFIGLSLDETTWGKLISNGVGEIDRHPHLALIPSTVMFLTILALNFVGDSIRQLFDPQEVVTARAALGPAVAADGPAVDVTTGDTLLAIRELHTALNTPGGIVRPVNGVSLDVRSGEALGVVGESGSGKTMILRSILGTFPVADVRREGRIVFDGVDLLQADDRERRRILGTRVGTISQNPLTALNPVRRIGAQIMEPMLVHGTRSKADAKARALRLLEQVGIQDPAKRFREYPHQLSGGMRQRITIAIALANEPDLLLADEPTTALDVTVQDQIMRLLGRLREDHGMALVLVTHDLAVVEGFTDRVAIVYAGEVVEVGPTAEIFRHPRHRYTLALMQSIPNLALPSHSELAVIEGQPPSLITPPDGCRFAPRCDRADDRCRNDAPTLETVALVESGAGGTGGASRAAADHAFACWHPAEQPVALAARPAEDASAAGGCSGG